MNGILSFITEILPSWEDTHQFGSEERLFLPQSISTLVFGYFSFRAQSLPGYNPFTLLLTPHSNGEECSHNRRWEWVLTVSKPCFTMRQLFYTSARQRNLLDQCLNVLVKSIFGPCVLESKCTACQKKVHFKWAEISQAFSLSCRSAIHKDAWLISAKQELFLYQTHAGMALIHLTACAVFWQSQRGLRKDLSLLTFPKR